MTIEISRRMVLAGAGSALALAGNSSTAFAATSSQPDFGPEAADVFGPAPGVAQLSRNENPFGPSPSAVQAIARNASNGAYYADRGVKKMVDLIAERYSVTPENVVLSSGSTEVLICAAMALPKDKAILCPDLFWDTTVQYAVREGTKVKRVPLGADMAVDLAAMTAAVGPDIGMIQICNPNNPTGMSLDGDALRTFIRSVDPAIPVLIDEAYMELAARPDYTSMVDLLGERDNLIITRTFSKIYGMAGLRLGYALTSPALAETLRGHLMSFGGNTAGLAAGIASFNDKAFLQFSKNHIVEAREAIMEAVKSVGLTALPSDTNFVYVKVPDADALYRAMAEAKVDIRPAYGKWTSWSRVSTGKMEDVQRYAKALHAFYGA
jgi:histidinol-phosphate aminotransferase